MYSVVKCFTLLKQLRLSRKNPEDILNKQLGSYRPGLGKLGVPPESSTKGIRLVDGS